MRSFLRAIPAVLLMAGASLPTTLAVAQDSPVITATETAARRAALAARIENGVVVAYGGRELVHDFNAFHQLPSFRYLTDFLEPDAALVMVVKDRKAESTLFLTALDPRTAFYYGVRATPTSTLASHGIAGRAFGELTATLDSLARAGMPFFHIADVETVDFAASDSLTRGQEMVKALQQRYPKLVVRDGMPVVLALRARKSDVELALIRKAAAISAEGHRAAMLTANPQHEYELRAALEYEFTRRGAARPAYGSIVGAGINGTQLHYMTDADPIGPHDLVVMDAGAEYAGYAADITRTIPVSGTFTPEQRKLYQLVRDAQAIAERFSQAGMSMRAAADSSVAVRQRGLAALGLVESVEALFDPPWKANCAASPASCRQSNLWTIHGITHGLGLEVHDPLQGSFGSGQFAVGDAFTIEPGIYISTRALDVLPDTPRNRAFIAKVRDTVLKYQNTGVRIEDDYVITSAGLERISMVPREINEIEALMKQRQVIQP